MAKFRVFAQSISYVYIDIEAEDEEKAMEVADALDGGRFHDTPDGNWVFDDPIPLDDDDPVDYTYEEVFCDE